jgi:hypothetical protein
MKSHLYLNNQPIIKAEVGRKMVILGERDPIEQINKAYDKKNNVQSLWATYPNGRSSGIKGFRSPLIRDLAMYRIFHAKKTGRNFSFSRRVFSVA